MEYIVDNELEDQLSATEYKGTDVERLMTHH